MREIELNNEFSVVCVQYRTEVFCFTETNFEFDPISIDISLLDNEFSKGLQYLKIKRADKPHNRVGDLIIEAQFEYKIKYSSNIYKKIMSEVDGTGNIYDKIFNSLFEKEIRAYNKIINDIIHYLSWIKDIEINYKLLGETKTLIVWSIDGKVSLSNEKVEYTIRDNKIYYFVKIEKTVLVNEDFVYFSKLQSNKIALPLHHELLSEVKRLIDKDSNRSAYLMMFTAFEVATKSLIANRKSEAKWLINNMPSPDLYKLYTQFIHNEICEILDKEALENLRNIIKIRNELAHQGVFVENETLRKHLKYINSWMKLIDNEMGYDARKDSLV